MSSNALAHHFAIIVAQASSDAASNLIPYAGMVIAALITIALSRVKRDDTQTAAQQLVTQLAKEFHDKNDKLTERLDQVSTTLHNEQTAFEKRITEKQESIDRLVTELATLQDKVRRLEEKIAHMSEERETVDRELEAERKKAAALSGELNAARARITELESDVAKMKVRLDSRTEMQEELLTPLLTGFKDLLNQVAPKAIPVVEEKPEPRSEKDATP